MHKSVKLYSLDYWINRNIILKFMEHINARRDLERKICEDPANQVLRASLYHINKYIDENTPEVYSDKIFYQIA